MKNDIRIFETTERVVRASRADTRDWLARAPVCEALAQHGIAHVGIAEAAHPYAVKRPDLSGTFIMACLAGEGRVWIEGRWQPLRSGTACLAPPHSFHAYRALPRKTWNIAWVRYQMSGSSPLVSARAPVLAAFDGGPLAAAIEGLRHEADGEASLAAMQLWADLIQHYARSFAKPWRVDDRLCAAWKTVADDLSTDWSLNQIASLAGMGAKQFGRLCRRSLGRTPARHLTMLRLQRAAFLLSKSSDKVESIARQVGYRSLFTFSNAFRKFTNHRPSEYRRGK